jgi:hypothetical protein
MLYIDGRETVDERAIVADLIANMLGARGVAGRRSWCRSPNHDDNQHTFNENLRLQNLWDGIELMAALLTM